jgi:phytanoyl-CoA hydroxylase
MCIHTHDSQVLPQSMYIFKQPRIGDVVTSHQDSTFLHTTPKTTCLGLWLALQDATLSNGCLWARPGSHKESVRRQFVRNPAFFENGTSPMMTFRDLVQDEERVGWEGGLPDGANPEVCVRALLCSASDNASWHPLSCSRPADSWRCR